MAFPVRFIARTQALERLWYAPSFPAQRGFSTGVRAQSMFGKAFSRFSGRKNQATPIPVSKPGPAVSIRDFEEEEGEKGSTGTASTADSADGPQRPTMTSREECKTLVAVRAQSILKELRSPSSTSWDQISLDDTKFKFKLLKTVCQEAVVDLPGAAVLSKMHTTGDVARWIWEVTDRTIRVLDRVEKPIPEGHQVARWYVEHAEKLPANVTFIPHVSGRAQDIKKLIRA
ncbi:hypothetical protein BJ684DRAFT_16410 [Piptocephalis cylindrospora]|uniref:Large ribosomal subunit protein mL50 n=1 Tax=Piptocephalis cylindrospora TaxID=1907219 RepID=A0A4P9Y2U5_9FUNG|nr:hypothetical protein BJ684DRAFT_16410 [Piptocephalis cylindrospora]|eukprot:RKP13165.1 hypothetical protein BJ684DRAFT_16410 [Piptocephalis cylindrospora]